MTHSLSRCSYDLIDRSAIEYKSPFKSNLPSNFIEFVFNFVKAKALFIQLVWIDDMGPFISGHVTVAMNVSKGKSCNISKFSKAQKLYGKSHCGMMAHTKLPINPKSKFAIVRASKKKK